MAENRAARKLADEDAPEAGDLPFEQAVVRLEAIVSRLEAGDLALDEALALFEEGVRLSRACARQLEAAEGRIALLLEEAGGEGFKLEPARVPTEGGREAAESK